MSDLTFRQFSEMNRNRCGQAFGSCHDWSLNDWAVALAGEVGELCNILKKVRRGDFIYQLFPGDDASPGALLHAAHTRRELLKELADVITYADLMMSELNADTGEEVLAKFDEVSKRVGWNPAVTE